MTQSGLHFNSITVASRCVYARWYGGLGGGVEGEGRRGVARVVTGRLFRRLLLYPDEGLLRVKH